ncbi:MAG TPA: sigma-70 family RNA polymerase sigma factor, partial [Candidatus Acidoferrales bacterium]|nr:sigma-70 family RNA polymerase sigma factor [Candidatus Acidoferrales bacterium]
ADSSSPEEQVGTPDHSLVMRIVGRDESALAELYDRYGSLVYGVALRVLRDVSAAEEVLQDIFHRLWNVAGRFDPARGSLPAWLAVTARHRAIDRLRQREPATDSETAAAEISLPFDLEEQVFRGHMLERIRAALARMPESQRKLVELAYFEGLTHTELAERTGEPLGTIKGRLRAAVASLRKEFGGLADSARK